MSDTASPLKWQSAFAHDLGHFREWLGQRDERVVDNGVPVWWELIQQGGWATVEELLAVSDEEHDVYLDWKDPFGRGWMWAGLKHQMPPHLLLQGLRRLRRGWDTPDLQGVDPLSLATQGQCIHGIAQRLWRDAPTLNQNRIRTLAQLAPTPAARRAWHFWAHGIHS